MTEKAYIPEEQKSYSIAELNSVVLRYAFFLKIISARSVIKSQSERFWTDQVSVNGKLENSAAVAGKLIISVFAEMPFNK